MMCISKCCAVMPAALYAPHNLTGFPNQTLLYDCHCLLCAEHVQHLETYLSEATRVLKPNGHLLISWKPSWQSPRGHHLHPDMVRKNRVTVHLQIRGRLVCAQ